MMIYAKKTYYRRAQCCSNKSTRWKQNREIQITFLQHSNKSADSKTQPTSNPGHRKQTIIPVTAMVEQRQDDIDN